MIVAIYFNRQSPTLAGFDLEWFHNFRLRTSLKEKEMPWLTLWHQLEIGAVLELEGSASLVDVGSSDGPSVYKLVCADGGGQSIFAQDVLTLSPDEMPGVRILFRIDWQRRCKDAGPG